MGNTICVEGWRTHSCVDPINPWCRIAVSCCWCWEEKAAVSVAYLLVRVQKSSQLKTRRLAGGGSVPLATARSRNEAPGSRATLWRPLQSAECNANKGTHQPALRMQAAGSLRATPVICFVVTKSLLLTCCLPIFLMGMRYYFSRKVILSYLECALHTDMSDIEQYYMKPPGSCFWVAVLDGNVVGIVAARGNEEDNTMELRRMSVDINFRGKGIAKALGRKVLEFAMLNNYSSIVLGTTAVKMAAHKLYESLGFKHVGVIEHYTLPGMTHSILERMFFQLRYHRYRLQLREE
ncbi:N-acetylaspartate synthetase isoform X1 [Pelodiscus sinensis]|uniref:N-acetylaspartate synthetase isoform X1 n=1 Tax=Pelodiscus sinensis TaxID=13735 RepID=UPI003F6CEB09